MSSFITYSQQLELPEWKEKRESILRRDGYRCSRCGHSPSLFELHGKYIGYDSNCKVIDGSNIQHITHLSIDEFKRLFNCTSIETRWIRPFAEDQTNFGPVGMTNNGILILIPLSIEECETLEKVTLEERKSVLNRLSTICLQSGECYHVLSPQHVNLSSVSIRVPYVTQYRVKLNVHHKYYLFSAKAWEYPDSALVTLCEHCHLLEHQHNQIKVYTYNANNQMVDMNYTPCTRCHGAGYFPQWNHIEQGVCFRCHGARFEELIQKE